MKYVISLIALVTAFPALAEDTRHLEAHEHGVGTLNIAIDGTTVAMEFEAPGADIVGFEYHAESDADLAAVEAAITTLAQPLDMFVLPAAAECRVVDAAAALAGDDDHDAESHTDKDGHTEFHAEYMLTCTTASALTDITFAFFDAFPNAKKIDVQVITASGAQASEVSRETPVLNLGR